MPNTRRRARGRASLLALLGTCWLWCVCGTVYAADPPLDLNTADAAALAATLPGIGPVKARAIVEHRARHGPFADVDALLGVRGIGPVTLERIREHLRRRATAPGASPIDAGPGRPEPGSGAAAPRSTSELERAARAAVQALVAHARADAEARGAGARGARPEADASGGAGAR